MSRLVSIVVWRGTAQVWRHYWVYWARSQMSVPATGRYVPTEVVQTFYDFLGAT